MIKDLLKDVKLQTIDDYFITDSFFNTYQRHLALYFYDRCYVVIHNKKVIGLFPEWEYDLEKIKNNFENEDYKNEIKIYSPLQKSKDTSINYINRLRNKEER
jgi:hypothetical protein